MMLVLGSGPAGVACAKALLARGVEVTMLDGGERLEPSLQHCLDELMGRSPADWNPAHLQRCKAPVQPPAAGLPMKRTFGSDYPYRAQEHLPVEMEGADILSSLAQGGLSNVWGANILPFIDGDIDAWPISRSDLEPHYREVLSFVPASASRDGVESLFPLYTDNAHPLRLSRQAEAMMSKLRTHGDDLANLGLYGGQSRLAVRVPPASDQPGCAYCGQCLYGCPYELIYSSRHTLPELISHPSFRYVPGRVVRKIEEGTAGVLVHTDGMDDGAPQTFEGDRVFVGCGTVESTRLLLSSLGMYDQSATIHDSQYFLTPFIQYQRSPKVQEEELHTLSQLMIEVLDEEVTSNSVHLLMYGYSDLFRRALEAMMGPLLPVARFPLSLLLERMMVIQGYLHSDVSPSLTARLKRGGADGRDVLHLKGHPNPEAKAVIRRVLAKVSKASRYLGGRPLSFKTEITAPGKSYHAGASFPMASKPEGLQSDILGRPVGMTRTHLIDASCFTNIPATNVTLSVMANAHRIGTTFDQESICP